MRQAVRQRSEIPTEFTWDITSVFPSEEAFERTFKEVEDALPKLETFRGRLPEGAATLLDWFSASESVFRDLGRISVYASAFHNVETTDQAATARSDRAMALYSRVAAAASFAEPEMLGIGMDTLTQWMRQEPKLQIYDHYFDSLESRREHVRSEEVEQVLGMVREPFGAASSTHRVLADANLVFAPARTTSGDTIEIAQGNINRLITDTDREVRRTAYQNYADAHLALKNTFANCLSAGVKQDVFTARVRRYNSSLEASLLPNHIPVEVFRNLIDAYRRNLSIWHRYFALKKQILGYQALHIYDVTAPMATNPPELQYNQAVEWIIEGMRPMGDEYVVAMKRGITEERWVDVYPNQGKRAGAFSMGSPGTHPFIMMSYNDDMLGLSTLAHELGHSMHSYYTHRNQPFVYARYGMFVAEVASNFNQALVRSYLLETEKDPNFEIALIDEAMANFHRYFFTMPALARFELEMHDRAERGDALTAQSLMQMMADIYREAYGSEVEMDEERAGITWAQFPIHMYANFYVFQYATGIAAAQALAEKVVQGGPEAAAGYLSFLKAGGSIYPLDALKLAGVDMASPGPLQGGFKVMSGLVDRLSSLLNSSHAASAPG